jgi:uncharacterized membrane protein
MFDHMPASSRYAWMAVTVVMGAICILSVLPPFVGEGLRAHILDAFAPVCHQLPERSFAIDGIPLAVGHRCTGIYLGLLVGALSLPMLWSRRGSLRKHSPLILFTLLVFLAVDWIGPFLGDWLNSVSSRVVTGLVFGGGAGYYAAEGLTELLERSLGRWIVKSHAGT